MTADLGVPEHARLEWNTLHDLIASHRTPTPCAGEHRNRWMGSPRDLAWAAEQCLDCPVMGACLTYARAADERSGVWGGTLPAERHPAPGPTRRPAPTRKEPTA
ncbi:WhiB family transcriptional regulator [Brachybacterium huguangmaarense]